MIGKTRAARVAVVALAIAAGVNMAAGAVIAFTDPGRTADLQTMYGWCRAWLLQGASLYLGPDANTDYPPNAIVLLAPLALLPAQWVVPIWTVMALVLTPLLVWLVMRAASPHDRGAGQLAVPVLLVLCWAAPRTLLQFSVLSLTLAAAALVLADTAAAAAGVALGLALFKPHIASPIALWMMVTGRIKSVLIGAAVALAGWAVYDVRIGESPLATAAGLWHIIRSAYTGADGLVGITSLRGLTLALSSDSGTADAVWLSLSAAVLIAICWIARRDRTCPLDAGGLAVPALFSLWSLAAIYHNGNNLILMLPAFAFLWFRPDRASVPAAWMPIIGLQLALVVDVPARLRDVSPHGGWIRFAIVHFDRAIVMMTLIAVFVLWRRLTATPAGDYARLREPERSASRGG